MTSFLQPSHQKVGQISADFTALSLGAKDPFIERLNVRSGINLQEGTHQGQKILKKFSWGQGLPGSASC